MKRMLIRISGRLFFVALICFARAPLQAQDLEAPLVAALRSQSFEDVVAGLKSGRLAPPAFVYQRDLVVDANKTFPLFLTKLQTERESARARKFQERRYAEELAQAYEYFEKYPSYVSILLCDTIKRMMLEWSRQQVVNADKAASLDEVSVLMKRSTLRAETLRALWGEQGQPSDEAGKSSILEMSQRLWESHGYTEVTDGYRGIGQVLRENMWNLDQTTSSLIETYKPVNLALRVLLTEGLCSVSLEGTIAFYRRGGDLSKVNLSDVRYFHSVMPAKECARLSFMAVGKKSFDAAALLNFAKGRPSYSIHKNGSGTDPFWLDAVLE